MHYINIVLRMSEPAWHPHLTVAAIIERNGRLLCVEEHPRHNNVINQPAGHVDPDETIVAAICREVLEETGYIFHPEFIVGIYYFQGSNGINYLRVCYGGTIERQQHDGPIDPDITQTHWLTPEELKQQKLRNPVVLDCINDYFDGQHYPLQMIKDRL